MGLRLHSTFLCLLLSVHVLAITLPSSYDVVWTTQSQNSAGSMPVGGGDIGLNVWAENGTVLFYIQKNGAFDENNSLPKLGRIRLEFDPNPFSGGTFEQRLVLNDGYVRFTGNGNTTVSLWVDVFNPIIHVEVESPETPISAKVFYESWRYEDYVFRPYEHAQSSWGQGVTSEIPNATVKADSISFRDGGVLMSHRNTKQPMWDLLIEQQYLTEFKDELYNPLHNNEFGMWLYSPQLMTGNVTSGFYVNTPFKAWSLISPGPARRYNVAIAIYQNQTESHEAWEAGLQSVISESLDNGQEESISWWHHFWDRSYIIINEDAGSNDGGFQVGKNYQIWRYIMGCNAYGEWPTRFNGGLFTFDPVFTASDRPFTPDWRRWSGGTFTAQNQRLLYWPMLRSGDFDVMKPQFDFYKHITPTGLIVGKKFFNVTAAHFTEQIENSGLPNLYEYDGDHFRWGYNRPPGFNEGETFNSWLVNLQDTANEFADMILQANIYSGLDVQPYLQFIEHQLAWFDQHYQQLKAARDVFSLTGLEGEGQLTGKLVIFPATGAETYHDAYNPSSTISGLRTVINHLLQVGQFEVQNRSYYESYLNRLPETPLRTQQGRTTISPALAFSRIRNSEVPQLYPVFPWGEYGLGLPNLSYALDTYYYDTETQDFHSNVGWKQDVIWLARMGVTEEASNMTEDRWSDSTTYRFPVFKGPYFDWSPDMNHYGSAAIGLQEQLMQTFNGRSIRLLGAWPDRWNARFKLWAPENTTVEATVSAGQVQDLVVTPESRLGDVVYGSE